MPSDRVHAIAQGPDGSMWFGTEAGLAKFDGRRTQTIIVPDILCPEFWRCKATKPADCGLAPMPARRDTLMDALK